MALADKAGISFSLIIAARALLPLYLRLDNTKNSSLVTATQGRCTVAENFTVHKIVYPPRKTSMQLLSWHRVSKHNTNPIKRELLRKKGKEW